MGDMADAVNPDHIDTRYDHAPAMRGSVLADPAAEWFDSERGNASDDEQATAVAVAVHQGRPVVLYTNRDNLAPQLAALAVKELRLADRAAWPAPGVYLWAAAPGETDETVTAWAGVHAVAIQDRPGLEVDLSTTFEPFPYRVAGYIDGPESEWPAAAWDRFEVVEPAPAPPPSSAPTPPAPPAPPTGEGMADVQVPVLAEGAKGASVEAAQKLLGGLAVDGDFGPLTADRVRTFQAEHGLAADGIIGLHTWGGLLGHPQ